MHVAFRTAPAVLSAATLAVATAACGSSGSGTSAGSSATPNSNALAGMSADKIVSRAVSDLGASSSVHVSGTVTDSGQTISLNLALARGEGCQGGMNLAGKGSFQIVNKGSTVWIKPTDAFYRSAGASSAAVSLLSGKWLRVPASSSGLGSLSSLCNASSLAHSFAKNDTDFTKGPVTTVNGQPALELNHTTDSAHVFVSESANPEILWIQGPKHQGYVSFTGYNTPTTISTPPASETLDGTKYGF